MQNVYQRKPVSVSGSWTEEGLQAATASVQNNGTSIYAKVNIHSIARKTLERRFKKLNDKQFY